MFQKLPVIKHLPYLSAALLLTACGGQDSSQTNTSSAPISVQTPPATQTAAREKTPLERGAKVYKKCKTCHTLEQGGRHKVGPNMWDLYGSTAGTREGFAYSKVMKESGIVWDDKTIDAYIENPRKYMPGNRMTFVGLRKPEDREAVLLYIKANTSGN